MNSLDQIDWETLNATADDWESLETIYRSLNRAEDRGGALGPVGQSGPLLEVVADGIRQLVEGGFLEARLLDTPDQRTAISADLSYIWRAWFRMTPAGRAAWEAAAPADLTRPTQ
jgi:hypothetical protein